MLVLRASAVLRAATVSDLRQTQSVGHTVIQLDVPELEPMVRPLVIAANPAVSIPDDGTVCAHITLLGPFVDEQHVDAELLTTLHGLLDEVSAFTFELSNVRRFPSGLLYLAPRPAEPFTRLTAMLTEAFPDWPPYGGAFHDVVPHLSLGSGLSAGQLQQLQARLPIAATADAVSLTGWSDGSIKTLTRIPLRSADDPR
jgi:hypothetical protein